MDNGAGSYHRYLNGDWEGLKEITQEYYEELVSFLRNRGMNSHDAEDLAEETLLVLADRKPNYTEQASFKTWLFRIARNLAVDYQRKYSREIPLPTEELRDWSNHGEEDLPEYIREDDRQRLRSAMRRLRKKYRLVLSLRYLSGMSVEEIAFLQNSSIHSVNGLLRRAKKALRAELRKEGIYERSE